MSQVLVGNRSVVKISKAMVKSKRRKESPNRWYGYTINAISINIEINGIFMAIFLFYLLVATIFCILNLNLIWVSMK